MAFSHVGKFGLYPGCLYVRKCLDSQDKKRKSAYPKNLLQRLEKPLQSF